MLTVEILGHVDLPDQVNNPGTENWVLLEFLQVRFAGTWLASDSEFALALIKDDVSKHLG